MSVREGGIRGQVELVRRHLDRRALLVTVLWVGAAGGVLLLLAWLTAGPEGWRQGSPLPLLLDGGVLVIVAAAVVFLFRTRRRWLREGRVGSSMEGAAGLASGTVLGSLELAREVPDGASVPLAREGERAIVRRLQACGDGSARALSGAMGARADHWLRLGTRALGIVLPVVLLAGVIAPQRAWVAWSGLAVPFHLLAAPTFPALVLEPGDVEVQRGEALDVAIGAVGRDEVTLHWQVTGDVPDARSPSVAGGRASFTFESITAPLEYWVSASDGARTPRFTATPVDPLFLSELRVELDFPAHTNRPPEEYHGEPPALSIPAGTRMGIEGRASRALSGAELLSEEAGAGGTVFDVMEARFHGAWTPGRSGSYRWSFRDLEGAEPEGAPAPLDVTIVPDAAPGIRFVVPGRDTVFPLSLRQPLVIEAMDDYGIAGIELVAYRVSGAGVEDEPVVERLEVGGARGVVVRPTLNVSSWGLRAGDEVHYLARALDNAPRAQRTETPLFVLRMPESREVGEDARERLDQASRNLEALAERAAAAEEETRTMQRQSPPRNEPGRPSGAQRNPESRAAPMDFEARESMRRSVEEQGAMLDEVEAMRSDLDDLAAFVDQGGQVDPQLRRDLNELQELLAEIAPPELRERLDELTRSLDQAEGERSTDALQELGEEQERFRERLEASLERFRRAAIDQEMRAVTDESEAIAQEEARLAEALRDGEDAEANAAEQAGLEERARELGARLDRLEERSEAVGEPEAGERARSAGERSQEARQAMSEAAQQALSGNSEEAGEQAEDAAAAMEEVAEELRRMQEEMAERQRDALREVLDRTIADALGLARRQSQLGERMRSLGRDALVDLQGDESALLQGVRGMSAAMEGVSGLSPEIAREVGEALGEAGAAVEATLESLGNRPIASRPPVAAAEDAVDALNRVALAAMRGMDQMEAGEEGSDANQLMQELGELAQQQGELSDEAGALMQMEQGQALSEQMQQLARGQESIAGALDELADRPGSQEQALGDLGEMARESEALAREIEGGRLDPELLERQEQLFQRLLDAGRSLEQEEFSDEREAEQARAFEVREIEGLTAEVLQALRFAPPGATDLQRLSPAQRQLVLDYFERLNRDPRADPPGEDPER